MWIFGNLPVAKDSPTHDYMIIERTMERLRDDPPPPLRERLSNNSVIYEQSFTYVPQRWESTPQYRTTAPYNVAWFSDSAAAEVAT